MRLCAVHLLLGKPALAMAATARKQFKHQMETAKTLWMSRSRAIYYTETVAFGQGRNVRAIEIDSTLGLA